MEHKRRSGDADGADHPAGVVENRRGKAGDSETILVALHRPALSADHLEVGPKGGAIHQRVRRASLEWTHGHDAFGFSRRQMRDDGDRPWS